MKHKKYQILCITFILSILSVCFADNGNEILFSKVSGFVNLFSSLIIGISVLMIVYAGFKYATAMGDVHASESAKYQIISASVGLFIAFTATMLSKMFLNIGFENEIEPSYPDVPSIVIAIPILIVVVAIITAFTIVSKNDKNEIQKDSDDKVSDKESEMKAEIVPTENVSVAGFMDFTHFLNKQEFSFDKYVTIIKWDSNPWNAKYSFEESVSTLKFYLRDKLIMTSYSNTDNAHITNENIISDNIELSGDKTALVNSLFSLHNHFIQQYTRQHFNLEEWNSFLIRNITNEEIKTKLSSLITFYHNILSYHHQFDDEQIFFMEESFPNDLENVLNAYRKLPISQQKTHINSLLERMSTLENMLSDIEESINTQLERDIMYAFRVIDKKYNLEK